MKKNLLILATAALTMTACSNDETIEVNKGTAIAFRTAVNSRATQTTTSSLNKFYVSAVNKGSAFMSDVEFSKGAGDVFTSYPEYRWPTGEVKFYAYSPAPLSLGIKEGSATAFEVNDEGATLNDFAPDINIANQVDFITATATSEEVKEDGTTKSVALEFSHNLTQIEIKAKNDNSNYIFSILGVKIARVASEGDFTFNPSEGESAWSLTDDKTQSYNVFYESAIELNANERTLMTNTSGNAMLLPQQLTKWNGEAEEEGAYLAVLVNIKTANGSQIYPTTEGFYNWIGVGIGDNWEAGKYYTYTLDFTNGAGFVTPDHDNGDVDPDDVDPTDPGTEPGSDPDDDDPFVPGTELLGGPISFTATVSDWTQVTSNQ